MISESLESTRPGSERRTGMGLTADFSPETLIVGVLSADPQTSDIIVPELESCFGPVDYESPVLDFNYTEYYTPEMGAGLKRWFYSFRIWFSPTGLDR